MEKGKENRFMAARASADSKEIKLFKISGVGIATFFGSIFAGGVVLAFNYLRRNELTKARKAFFYSFLSLVGIIAFDLFLPAHIHDSVYIVTQLVIMVQIAKQLQESCIRDHVKNGGKLLSNWLAFALSIIITLPIIGFLFLIGRL
jgi:hypothetical protein